MKIVVQKYGGSSVADLGKIRAVADRIARGRARGESPVVVVSAMGNTTNELIALAREMTPEPDRRELDMLISVGERISMALLAMALRDRGITAVSLTGSQSGIITNEDHADAKVVEVRPDRVLKHLDEGAVVIVAGFQGVSRDREVTTLGRGGSDTTAVVLAAALNAEHCEICSDVDGVWTADPRSVSTATKIDQLSYTEALGLARGGAKVLFEDALRYARDHDVKIIARSTFGPGSGTRIVANGPERDGAVAVAGDGEVVRVRLTEVSPYIGQALRSAGIRVRRKFGRLMWVDVRNAHGGLGSIPGIRVEASSALVTAVGSGLGGHLEWVLAGEMALKRCTNTGCDGDSAWFEVPPYDLQESVRAVHDAMVE